MPFPLIHVTKNFQFHRPLLADFASNEQILNELTSIPLEISENRKFSAEIWRRSLTAKDSS